MAGQDNLLNTFERQVMFLSDIGTCATWGLRHFYCQVRIAERSFLKRKIITCVLTLVFVLCAFSTIAYAKNFDISFTLTPNGSSGYSGTGYKVDSDPKCYITTTGGSVISNNLIYKCRGKAITSSGYADATELSNPAYQGAITSETLYI